MMDITTALEIVINLAEQNIIDKEDCPEEHARQREAIDTVTDMAVNQFGDE
jgi:hypothetical protein